LAGVPLYDRATARRNQLGARPEPFLGLVALALARGGEFGLVIDGLNLAFGNVPRPQGAFGTLLGVAIGDDVVPSLVQSVFRNGALLKHLCTVSQSFFVEPQLHKGVHQVALAAADVGAPYHGQHIAFIDTVAWTNLAEGRLTGGSPPVAVGHLGDLDDFGV